jgi:HJR/Mrr/RecB family endonuclease
MISIKHNELSAGVAFDNYTLSSEHTSDGRFINVYTVLGQLIHDLKYSDSSLDSQKKIINKVISIIDENFRKIDFLRLNNLILVPAPSTKQKDFSTVVELVKKMSEYFDIPFLNSFSKLTCIFAKRLPHGIEFSEDDFT